MPKTKQFEAVDINELIFGTGESKWLDMYDISAIYFEHITQTLKFLEEGKIASIEIPEDNCHYYLKKVTSELFILEGQGLEPFPKTEFKAIDVVNWLFRRAPFISIVGYSNF